MIRRQPNSPLFPSPPLFRFLAPLFSSPPAPGGEPRGGRQRTLRRRLPPLGPSALAELDLLDLAGAGHRKRVDECDVARDLEARYAAVAVLDHLALSQLAATRELHERHCHVCEPCIGHPD